MALHWPSRWEVWLHTRAICMSCEAYYWAIHPLGQPVFYCPFCRTQTGQAIHG